MNKLKEIISYKESLSSNWYLLGELPLGLKKVFDLTLILQSLNSDESMTNASLTNILNSEIDEIKDIKLLSKDSSTGLVKLTDFNFNINQ